eukprot:GFUD01032569.1.p1 GENE.GFUD01032569.1~~GFUD01032569.1.p1  ORF type:complete len:322 (-),score=119.71 GFUD01032569.1:93-1058(-)
MRREQTLSSLRIMVKMVRMMGLLLAMVISATAQPTEVFVSDVVDVKIADTDYSDPTFDNKVNEEKLKVINLIEAEDSVVADNDDGYHEVNFLLSTPNIENVDPAIQDYSEELYLPDEDPIDNTIDDSLGSDDIFDVIQNFIAERDPMLQLFLNLCFLHPTCYQLDPPSATNYTSSSSISPVSQVIAEHLMARRTETARNILVKLIKDAKEMIKILMFKYIEKGVGERGVSIMATKSIIDSVKSIWLSLNGDLEFAKSSIQELFYLLPLDTKEQVQAMVEISEVVQRIPAKTEVLLQEATQDGYQQYVRSSSWDSWKRQGGD